MIALKLVKSAILTINGQAISVDRIGKGRYSTAWYSGSWVYVQTSVKDYGKELLCGLSGTAHLPVIELIELGDVHNWYKMPLYGKLTTESGKAWADYKLLRGLLQDAWNTELHDNGYRRGQVSAANVNALFEDAITGSSPDIAARYGETVETLVRACANYGDGWLIEALQTRNWYCWTLYLT